MTDQPELFDNLEAPTEEETAKYGTPEHKKEVHIIMSSPKPGMLRLDTDTYGYDPDESVDGVLMLALGLVEIMIKPEYSMLRSMIQGTIEIISKQYQIEIVDSEEGPVDDERTAK